jgi:hypothetical protein
MASVQRKPSPLFEPVLPVVVTRTQPCSTHWAAPIWLTGTRKSSSSDCVFLTVSRPCKVCWRSN